LQNGDIAGFGTLGTVNGCIYVTADAGGNKSLAMMVDDRSGSVSTYASNVPFEGTTLYLRTDLNFQTNRGNCSYSSNGTQWTSLGGYFPLKFDITYGTFQGEKYAIFCCNPNTASSSGYVDVDSFTLGDTASPINPQRGRPMLNAARTTFVADNGRLLRGPFTSSEWGSPAPYAQIADMKNLGFNAVHLYGECFDINYPNPGSTSPGYAASRIDSVVASTRELGMYLVITIGNGANNGNFNYHYVMDFWKFYAPRYADETHVLYEIQNEPVAWGPPYLTHSNPPGAVPMTIDAYNIIRERAPQTPVLLFTYAVPWGTGGANDAMMDIRAFNAAVFGDENAVWTNEAVAIHGYSGTNMTAQFAERMIQYGYPLFQTEWAGGIWGESGDGFELYTALEMERLNISWLTFQYIPPWGVASDITVPKVFKDRVERAGMSWLPDFGTWPPQRGVFGNNGQPRATTGLSGTLRIQAEDFDTGGQSIAYHDTTGTNQGGQYRTDETVDIVVASDSGGGFAVGSTEEGEWLEYTIMVRDPGYYTLRLRAASPVAGAAARILCYNLDKTGIWTIPNTGGTQAWTTITRQVFLEYGRQKLRVEVVSGGFNLNWIELSPASGGPLADGTYKLVNQNSGLVIENLSRTVVQNVYEDTNIQRWNLQHIGAGQYRVRTALDNWQWITCILRPLGDGYHRLTRVDSGMNLEVQDASMDVGAAITANDYTGVAGQRWGVLAPSAPAFPVGLQADWVASGRIDLVWTPSAGALSYTIKRSQVSGGPYTTIAADVTVTGFSDLNVVNGQVYYYVVSANTAIGESLNSGEVAITPWRSQDIGAVQLAGSGIYSGETFTVSASGNDIWGSADAFHFVYLPVSGDCAITARVVSVQNTDAWAKAGVMIRETLNANSRNALVAVTPGNGVTWQYRSNTGSNSSGTNTTGLGAPYWVRLVRSGNTFTGFRSPDGITWTQQGTPQTIVMGSTVYLGLAVTSHNNTRLCRAEFDNVTAPGWPPPSGPGVPTGLSATRIFDGQVNLTWTAAPGATSYNIKRSAAGGGPYDPVAENITTTSFCDTNVTWGVTDYYVVSANTPDGESSNSNEAAPSIVSAYLKFNETSGTAASDTTGNGWNGTLVNGPLWAAGRFGNAVDFDGTNDHVTLPTGVVNGLTNFTIATWVYLDTLSNWSRIFDFGSGTSVNMFLTPRNGSTNTVRFAITTNGAGGEQQISGSSALPTGVWTHVAVTRSGTTGILYVNGAEVGRNIAMSLSPGSLGATTQNYIGRSQYADPYLDGRVDEFRIYSNALGPAAVEALYAEQVPFSAPETPTGLNATAITGSQIDLTWNASAGTTNYNIKCAMSGGGPYTLIASVSGTGWSDPGLSESTAYYYVVSAVNSAGESADSVQVAAITQGLPPAAPSGLAATDGQGSVILSWNPNTESDLAGYNVYRSTTPESGFTLLNGDLLSSPECIDNTISFYTTYYYVVTAVDTDSLESPVSNLVSIMPADDRAVVLSAADFEDGFGEWVNISDEDSHNWDRNSGGTLTPNTGPSGGAGGSTWYAYLETSPGGANLAGNTAILQGPMVGGYNRMLSFSYHMYGAASGTLSVDIFHDGAWQNEVWSRNGQQHTSVDQPYTQAIVNLTEYSGPIQIRFRAVAAGGPTGDMAIDDIEVAGRILYGDMNGDDRVDIDDLMAFAGSWLQEDCGPDLNGDCLVNLYEFAAFAENFLVE
jgi:fibronectin type 3 domain-containing protein